MESLRGKNDQIMTIGAGAKHEEYISLPVKVAMWRHLYLTFIHLHLHKRSNNNC